MAPLLPAQAVFIREGPVAILYASVYSPPANATAYVERRHPSHVVAAGIDSLEANRRNHVTTINGLLTSLLRAVLDKVCAITKSKRINQFRRKDVGIPNYGLSVIAHSRPEQAGQAARQDKRGLALEPPAINRVLRSEIVVNADERPVSSVILGVVGMSPAKIVRAKHRRIANIRQREIFLDRSRDRANTIRWNLVVRKGFVGLWINDGREPTEVAIPHRLRRNGSEIEGTQWN